MATYTGIADGSGNFTVDFGGEIYNSAQKVTVTATKGGASKTVELYSPSDPIGGEITWSGDSSNFPRNIGVVTLGSKINAAIADFAFVSYNATYTAFGYHATGLKIIAATSVGLASFSNWVNAETLELPETLQTIGSSSFQAWNKLKDLVIPSSVTSIGSTAFLNCTSLLSIEFGLSVQSIGSGAFMNATSCELIKCLSANTPTISSDTFDNLNSSCVIQVPSASLTAYQTATNWSVHASKMVGV
ncbi:MAG TPA: leucine-rich repeat domain-containing protein [Acinetobacter venetianus]|jgi:hypothetical protein|uniref:leucine-rich repeat domain-containing protein n=1 Tax=Acinetobacter venetianus TaxID=52133 RepID=UPI001A16F23A|nr:leucine-rich repeat domain-containing protein [Acinetobacter venetianus]HIQ36198.1 leucine-rich repeat domain-containing protein [Acinetobacter venetianus]